MPDKSKDKDIQEMRAEEAQRRSEPGEAPESRRHSGHEPRSDSGRRLLWISNGLMILGVLLLMGALGVNIMLAGSARVLWVRVVAGAAGVCFLAAMVMGYRDLIRWFRTRATQEGLLSLAFTVAVWAIVIFGVYMGQRYSHRIDATKDPPLQPFGQERGGARRSQQSGGDRHRSACQRPARTRSGGQRAKISSASTSPRAAARCGWST